MSEQFTEAQVKQSIHYLQNKYDEKVFWNFVKTTGKTVCKPVLRKALELYYAMKREDMPLEIKVEIMGAIAYLVIPMDLVPDFIPFIGWSDDVAALVFAYSNAQNYVDDSVMEQADQKLKEFLGRGL